MTKLEEYPQRVFYLINNPDNTKDNRSLWNKKVTHSDDGKTTTVEYTEIVAVKDNDDTNFSLITVKAMDIKKVSTVFESGGSKYSISRDNCRLMNWYDLDDDIVDIVNDYYALRNDLYERIIDYADAIARLDTCVGSMLPRVDENGLIKVTLSGLPVDTSNKYDYSDYDIDISSTESRDDYRVDIRGNDSTLSFTIKELQELIEKSKVLNKISDSVKKYIFN